MTKARYICIEGTEGVGKTTQVKKLAEYLRKKGYNILETKEPGTPLSPLTMELRKIMLDAQYDNQLTTAAREFISQAIRSIHLEKVVEPAMEDYDFIIQDRGVLSGFAYGVTCGNHYEFVEFITENTTNKNIYTMYDKVIYLTGDVAVGLDKAMNSKKEFESGDAIEAKGNEFMERVADNMDMYSDYFNTTKICIDGKNIDKVHDEILCALELE